jgi:hypothetical protein
LGVREEKGGCQVCNKEEVSRDHWGCNWRDDDGTRLVKGFRIEGRMEVVERCE